MLQLDREVSMDDSSLAPDAWARLKEIQWADVVIGIPSHRNGRTIAEVVHAVTEGITNYLPNQRVVLMNADGGSSDNTTRHVADTPVPANVEKLVTVYQGIMGKGTGIRAILEATFALNAKACLVVEARAPGIVPEWIPALINPVLGSSDRRTTADAAFGCYQRSAYGASLTENLVYPFVQLFLNADLREPLPSEFCISGDLAADLAERDVWETDVARFGVNVWLTTELLAENRRIVQVDLGYRGDPSGEPGAPLDARFLHTVGTLFRLLTIHRRLWQKNLPPREVPFHGGRCPDKMISCKDYTAELIKAMQDGRKQYLSEWKRTLSPKILEAILSLDERTHNGVAIPLDLWTQIVMEFAVIYNKGEGDPDKVIESFLPLFYGRTATYIQETNTLSPSQREAKVQEIAKAFAEARPFFIDRWNSYQPWLDLTDY